MFNKGFSNNVTEFLMLCQRDRGGQFLTSENFEYDTFLFLNNFVILVTSFSNIFILFIL